MLFDDEKLRGDKNGHQILFVIRFDCDENIKLMQEYELFKI